jgi:putative endonuclease
MHFVYIVRCADGTLYTGYAKDPHAREKAHNSGRGAKYTAGRCPVSLVYSEKCRSLGRALRREHELKRLKRTAKEALVRIAELAETTDNRSERSNGRRNGEKNVATRPRTHEMGGARRPRSGQR